MATLKQGKYWGDPEYGNGGWGCEGGVWNCAYKCTITGNKQTDCNGFCSKKCAISNPRSGGTINAGTYSMMPRQTSLSDKLSYDDGCYKNTGDSVSNCYWCYMKGRTDVNSDQAKQYFAHCATKGGIVNPNRGGVGTPTALTTTKKTAMGDVVNELKNAMYQPVIPSAVGAGVGYLVKKDLAGVVIGAMAGALAGYYVKSSVLEERSNITNTIKTLSKGM